MTWSGASLVMMAATLLAAAPLGAAPARTASCSKDRDCSGNTVCQSGSCVPKLSTATSDSSGTTSNATAANNARPSIVLLGLLAYGGIGLGARVEYPVALNVIKEIPFKNDIFVVAGLDYYTHSYDNGFGGYRYNYFRIEAGAMWNFWFLENFAAYPKLTLNYDIVSVSGNFGTAGSNNSVNVDAAAGIIYDLNSTIQLRAEVGNFALKAGVGFHFL